MRVLILHSRYLSGSASGENRVVEDETRLLREAGHHVDAWTPEPTGLSRLGLAATGLRAVWSTAAVGEVVARIRSGRYDVVHCHNLFPMLSPAVLSAAAREGSGVVVTLHNYRLFCLPATLRRDGHDCQECVGKLPWRGVVHRCYRGSALGSAALAASLSLHRALGTFRAVGLYLAVSSFVRDRYVEDGFPADRVRLKQNFAWPAERRSGPGEYFLYLGRLSPEKGVATLLEVWRTIPARLLVVGDGPESAELRRSAPNGVEFAGQVAGAEVPRLLAGARALLVPSRWPDSAPRVVLEAYASGVPVVASAVGGLPELVEHDGSGFLVEDGAGEWADAVRRLADDGLAEELGQGALRLWERRYSPAPALDRLLSAYEEAAGTWVTGVEPAIAG